MGQYFTQPNTALSMPGGPALAVGNPQQLAQAASSALPSADAMLGPDVLKPNQNAPELPFIRRPSVMEAAEAGAMPGSGQGNVFSPGLSKGGKLLTLLTSGLQGALAGRAAQEQAAVQSGGRRAGGVGLGFEAGYAQPFQRQEQAAQAGLAQAGLQPVETPYGNLPAALASKIISPYLGYAGRIGAAQIGGESREAAAQTGAQARIQAAEIGKRFIPVPNVGLYDTQSRQVIGGTQQGITVTPEIAQDYALPQDFIGRQMSLANFSSIQRANAQFAPTVRTSTDPLGLTTTSVSQKQRPGAPAVGANSRGVINQIPGSGGVPIQTGGPRPAGGTSRAAGGGGRAGGGALNAIDSQAQRLVEGDLDPSQLPKRGAQYSLTLQRADQYSMQKYGQHFDVAQAANDYQYARNNSNQNTLKMINGMTEKGGAIDIATNAAKNLPQLDAQTVNKVFNAAATEFGSTAATNFHTAMLGLADEYSKVMGGGISSDTGRDQALSLLKDRYSKGQLFGYTDAQGNHQPGAIDIMRQDIAARKQALIGNNRYLQRQYGQGTTQQGNSGNPAATHRYNPNTGRIEAIQANPQ